MLLGCARISKGDEQSNAVQVKALRTAGCRRIVEEAASDGRWDRPELHRMPDQLHEGDVAGSSTACRDRLKKVLHILKRRRRRAGFRSIERAIIRERTSAGLAAARAAGPIGGRRKKLDPSKRREIAESVISGRKTGAEMARLYNVSPRTVSRIVDAHRASLV